MSGLLTDDLVIVGMRANPEPMNRFFDFRAERTMMRSYPYRPELSELFEVK
jgi:hypothetical protein